jgi:hypothetical protein
VCFEMLIDTTMQRVSELLDGCADIPELIA